MHTFHEGYLISASGIQTPAWFGGSAFDVRTLCPNCGKPFQTFVNFMPADIGYKHRWERAPLIGCTRCQISWNELQYQQISESEIKLVKHAIGTSEHVGPDCFAKCFITFTPLTDSLQKLLATLRGSRDLTAEQRERYWHLAKLPVKAIAVPLNQMGGCPYISQGAPHRVCSLCGHSMQFVATLQNNVERKLNFADRNSWTQVVFYACQQCQVFSTSFHGV